jgi:probable F420-dependent oxidoreductase
MKFDLMLDDKPGNVGDSAEAARAAGLDGGWVPEAKHDPFLLLSTAASRGTGLTLGTAVAVAFARTPMLLAVLGNDLQLAARGKFVLGLGTQIKPHIERRYSMAWSQPVARMREMLTAIHAIWDSWETGQPLAFTGTYYQHTLMTPAFSPGPNPYGRPAIYLGALGPAMTELAGQYADGLIVHRFLSEQFIREVTLPRVQVGLARRETPLAKPFRVVYPPFVVTGDTDQELRRRYDDARAQIAFFASTPAFRPVLELHGWGSLGGRLHGLSREGSWKAMAGLVGDEVVETLGVVCDSREVRQTLQKRFDGAVDRIVLLSPTV